MSLSTIYISFQDKDAKDDSANKERKYSRPISIIVGTDLGSESMSSDSSTSRTNNETYEKLRKTILVVGWPVIQSGLSTFLGKFLHYFTN